MTVRLHGRAEPARLTFDGAGLAEHEVSIDQLVEAIPTHLMHDRGWLDVMDVVWWMTGLSPTKYTAEQNPNRRTWFIVRTGAGPEA